MSDPKIYDAKRQVISINALLIDSGYADGEFCRLERDTDTFTDVVGTDGQVTRSKSNDDRGTLTLTLMQTSEGNARLSALWNLDKKANNGAGVGPFLIKDLDGLSLAAGKAWVAKPPTTVLSRGAEAREWKLRVVIDEQFDGGA